MDERRTLPAIHRLVAGMPDLPAVVATREARALVESVRAGADSPKDWVDAVRSRVFAARQMRLRRVVNATGVVLHTNLGRAPLSEHAIAAVTGVVRGYCNVEIDLATGKRGERLDGVRGLLRDLCGADDVVVVNNNAAAVLLALTTIARGKEVIVSRGELVEIGGSFRVPDVITAGGARLVEVGTTNRTRLADFERAIGPDTAAILRVHPSNFRVVGFTEAPTRAELRTLTTVRGIPLLEDLGAGAVIGGLGEPTVADVAATADVVCFSGDKLLGGPQAGILVGKSVWMERMRTHPLYRALRLDRMVLAALEGTLRGYRDGEVPPTVAMLTIEPGALKVRANQWVQRLAELGVVGRIVEDAGAAGAGSLPGESLPGYSVALTTRSADDALGRLRSAGVIARVHDGCVLLSPRTVLPDDEDALFGACRHLAGA